MSRAADGTYSLVTGNPVVSGALIESTWANNTMTDLASSMTNSLDRNGQGGMLAALKGVDGTKTVPAYSYTSEFGSGWYRAGAADFRFTLASTDYMKISTTTFQVTVNGTTLTATSAGFVVNTDITGQTINATGDTAVGDNAAVGYTASEGLILTGQGSSYDITLKNDADVIVMYVPTGTVNVNMAGTLDVVGVTTVGSLVTAGNVDGRDVSVDGTKLDTIETNADITDATNVAAAGAVMEADTTTAAMGFVLDEDAMGSDSATKVATQQSIVAYVTTSVAAAVTAGMSYKGGYDAATNTPDLDSTPIATSKGDVYTVTAAGTFFTATVEIGDTLITEIVNATVEADWTIVQANLTPASIKVQYESNADTNAFDDAAVSKLAGIELLADVTDATNVAAAGAVMEADTSTASMGFVLDEDTFSSDSATKVATQQSIKAYMAATYPVTLPVADTVDIIKGSVDATKILRFEVDGFTSGATRLLTPQDKDGILAITDGDNNFSTVQTIVTPTLPLHAATKGYVDDNSGASWTLKTASYTLVASDQILATATAGAATFTLPATLTAMDSFIVHNDSTSTQIVSIDPATHSITGAAGTITSADTLTLAAGETVQMVARSTTILEIV